MYGKALLFVTLVVVGAVLPYLLSDDALLDNLEKLWGGDASAVNTDLEASAPLSSDPSHVQPGLPPFAAASTARFAPTANTTIQSPFPVTPNDSAALGRVRRRTESPPIVGPPGAPLEHLLSFEITPEWVSENWSRVSTRLAELDLDGWRVAVATGTTATDLTGSITYYFDQKRRVQRITLHGYAADASRIVNMAASRFGMQRIPSDGQDLYTASIEGEPIGGLRVGHPPIVRKNGRSVEILMELNRTDTAYGMSREFRQILQES
jgi:hypothetical protein